MEKKEVTTDEMLASISSLTEESKKMKEEIEALRSEKSTLQDTNYRLLTESTKAVKEASPAANIEEEEEDLDEQLAEYFSR